MGMSSVTVPSEQYIQDPTFDATPDAVREHYRRCQDVYETMGDLDGCPTTGFIGNSGWYNYHFKYDLPIDALANGHRIHRRAYTIETDFDALIKGIERNPDDSSWRTLYNITSWKDAAAVYDGAYAADSDDFEQGDGLAGYADLRGFPLWVDLDLADNDDGAAGPNYKRRRGALTDEQRATIEAALTAYAEEFAALYGLDPVDIAIFDSGGGAYLYGPAAATLPIADRYENDSGPFEPARRLIFTELRRRMFAFATGEPVNTSASDFGFEGIQPRVERRIDGAADLLDPDWMQNRNRQSKAPMSIHGDHDVVVTPARTPDGEVEYTPTRISAVDDTLVEQTRREAAKIVATPDAARCEAMTETLISTLFSEYYDRENIDTWTDALDAWVNDRRNQIRADQHEQARDERRQRERSAARRDDSVDPVDITSNDITADLADLTVTPVKKDVFDALADPSIVDVRDVIREHACDAFDTSQRGHEITFNPSWRASRSGQSCAIPKGENRFIDNGCDAGGGPATAYALGTGILPQGPNAAARTLSGENWGNAIDGLRSAGYQIPVYVPEADSENADDDIYDKTPLWALRNAAVALDVCTADAFVRRDAETGKTVADPDAHDGDTYLGFPDHETYNTTLEALEERGIDHGRDPIDPGDEIVTGGQHSIERCEPPAIDRQEPDVEQARERMEGGLYDTFINAATPHAWLFDPGVGKTVSAARSADKRDRPFTQYFRRHELARQAQTDENAPDGYHLKGAEQPQNKCCMDAQVEADPTERPECYTHGSPDGWPRMCPIYELDEEHEVRQAFEALAPVVGVLKAHFILGFTDEDEHDWHPQECAWMTQFDQIDDHDNIYTVHQYQTLKAAQQQSDTSRDQIVDESPSSLRSTTRINIEGLVRIANALDDLAGNCPRDEPVKYTAERFARFACDLVDALIDDGTDLSGLDAPTPIWNADESYDDAAGHHIKREEPIDDWHVAEALAQLKVAYTETMVNRITREDWDGTPLCIDALLTAAGEAGLPTSLVMQAVAIAPMLDACPWCGSELEPDNGARCCGTCEWHEARNALVKQDTEQARALSYLDLDPEPGKDCALVYEDLPHTSTLPDAPLVLDATASPAKIALIYGCDKDDVTIHGNEHLEPNTQVTQVLDGQYHLDTLQKSQTAGRRIRDTVAKAATVHDRVLVAGRKDLYSAVAGDVDENNTNNGDGLPANCDWINYHAARGLDLDDYDAVIAIGSPHPDPEDIRREATLIAREREDIRVGGVEHSTRRDCENPPIYRKLDYADARGQGRAVPTKHYTGLVGALFREGREHELEQIAHRARPVTSDDPVHIYLLTNVPTDLPIDEVCSFKELADPLEAILPVPAGALALLELVRDTVNGNGPNGFRSDRLVEIRDDGTVANKVKGYHRLARAGGMDVCQRTVYNYVAALEDVGLLVDEEYEQHAGVSYAVDFATLQSALQILSSNTGFKVAAVRRFRTLVEAADGSLAWLGWAREVFGLSGDRCEWIPPPIPA